MKVSKREYDKELYGIELIAENEEDKVIIRRFWDGGIKVNAITMSYLPKLLLTFLDLVKGESRKPLPPPPISGYTRCQTTRRGEF